MKIDKMLTTVRRKASRAGLVLKKHSPTIGLVLGCVGIVSAAVIACKKTYELPQAIEALPTNIENVEDTEDAEVLVDNKKEKVILIAKTYAPSVILACLSITCIVGSHVILTKRNISIMAAYAIIDKQFKNYRKRVVEVYGPEVDQRLYDGVMVDAEGEIIPSLNLTDFEGTDRVFNSKCPGWEKDPEICMHILKTMQSECTKKLEINGHLFLNEVYDLLGYTRTKAGACIGWVYNEDDPFNDNNYVSFGLTGNNEDIIDFKNFDSTEVPLRFNTHGIILDLITSTKGGNY